VPGDGIGLCLGVANRHGTRRSSAMGPTFTGGRGVSSGEAVTTAVPSGRRSPIKSGEAVQTNPGGPRLTPTICRSTTPVQL
jgi:hypothetical protein